MYSGTSIDDQPGDDDLYSACCDLYSVAREWLAAGAALHLDDLLATITGIEHLDEVADMHMIERYGPLVSGEPTIRSVVDETRSLLREHFSRHTLDEPALRQLREDLRRAMRDMQKAVGGLESRIADVSDLQQRIALRKQIHTVTDLQKCIRGFANMLTTVHQLRWESSFITTRIRVTPKRDMTCRPVQSPILEVEIPGVTEVEAGIEGESIVITVEGEMLLSVAGRPGIPDIDVSHAVIDKMEGVTITGRDREITLVKKGTKTDVQVQHTG